MNKKHILTLLSGALVFTNLTLGGTKDKEDVNLEDMKTPTEASADSSKKSTNPFPEQDKDLVSLFNSENTESVFSLDTEDPFMGIDPWDD